MVVFAWLSMLIGALVAGGALVFGLVLDSPADRVVGFTALGALVASLAGLVAVTVIMARPSSSALAAVIAFATFATGYSLGALSLDALKPRGRHPSLAGSEDSKDGIAVVLAVSAEPTHYDPPTVAAHMADLAAAGVSQPGVLARPMAFAAEKTRYRMMGSPSPLRGSIDGIAEQLGESLPQESFPRIIISYCERAPTVPQAVSIVREEGYRSVVVARLAVADSALFDRARRALDEFRPDVHGMEVAFTPPLWGSQSLVGLVVERVLDAAGDHSREAVGVVLASGGQPPEWAGAFPGYEEQETFFRQAVRARLLEAGLEDGHVRLAWIDWQSPDVSEAVRHLAALDCRPVFVVPSSSPGESTTTLVDLRQAVHFARVEETTEVQVLDAWGADIRVAEALAGEIGRAAADLDR
jgi:protoheme ferro-lyase